MITFLAILIALQITSMIINTYVFYKEYSKSGIITLEQLVIFGISVLPFISFVFFASVCVDLVNRNSDVVIYKRKEKK